MKPTTDEVLAWAREIYLYDKWNNAQLDRLETFAALAYAAGAAAMKERAAKVCEEFEIPKEISGAHPDYLEGKRMAVHQCAAAIRALGDNDET